VSSSTAASPCISDLALGDIPAWDNHNHAGFADEGLSTSDGSLRGFFTQWSWAYVEARMPQAEFRTYREAISLGGDRDVAKAIDQKYQIEKLIDDSTEMLQFTTMGVAIRAGCEALYGEYDDRERLNQLMREARKRPPNFLWDKGCEVGNLKKVSNISFGINRQNYSEKLYKWEPYLDPLFYPFPIKDFPRRGAMVQDFLHGFHVVLPSYMKRYGIGEIPSDFAGYREAVGEVVDGMLEDGAISFKVLSLYVRGLDFSEVAEKDAARVFVDMSKGDLAERKTFEDYIVRWIFSKLANDSRCPVNFHVSTTHTEPGTTLRMMDLYGLEETLFQDKELSNQPFIITHGGAVYPGVRQVAACLFHYGNVYADCSEWSYYEYSGGVDAVVTMTEAAPGHKLLWGTDGTVPEIFAGSAITSRKMLADALQRRVDSGSLPKKLMIPLAERILYKNAEKLYGISIDA
jgi:hypothetical protein